MNGEKDLKHKMTRMAVLPHSLLPVIALVRAENTIGDSTPEETVNYFHQIEMKGNVHFYTIRRDYTPTDSEDLCNSFTNDHITSQTSLYHATRDFSEK